MRPTALYRHPLERVGLLWTASAGALGAVLAASPWSPERPVDKLPVLAVAVLVAVATGYQALLPYCFIRDGKIGVRTVLGLRTVALDDVTGVERRDARAPLGRATYRYPAITVAGKVIPLDRAHYRPGFGREGQVEEFLRQVTPAHAGQGPSEVDRPGPGDPRHAHRLGRGGARLHSIP
ncbi:hypothetical protein [Actinokineospora inagensis]|uniref:hypothetical protein n=1 Tax=Actinokineospora inagensis TaxID=103730 RepID=UPI000429F18E|nr:hypothetical protein [Actinokineospora inagensis]